MTKNISVEFIKKLLEGKFFGNLLLLTLFLIITFSLVLLFHIPPFINFFPILNGDSLLDSSFSDIEINGIIISIVGASSTILAIVFAISQISITSISEKYTPYILKRYKEDDNTKVAFFGLIFIICLSLLFLYVYELLTDIGKLISLILIITSFVLYLRTFINYFYFTLDIANPITFSQVLYQEVLSNLKTSGTVVEVQEKNIENEVEHLINSMGDISIKSLQKYEKDTAIEYIRKIFQLSFYISKCYNLKFLKYILNNYFNIIEYSVSKKIEIRNMIIDRYILIPTYLKNRFPNEEINEDYKNYTRSLFEINKFIISKDDKELFEAEIYAMTHVLINDPKESIERVHNDLSFYDFINLDLYKYDDVKEKIDDLRSLVRLDIFFDFKNLETYRTIFVGLDELLILVNRYIDKKEELDRLKSNVENIKSGLFTYYIGANFHLIFFAVGAYCLFSEKQKGIEAQKYLDKLWFYTKPIDVDGTFINQVPVSSDIEYLFVMLFWGGKKTDAYWYDNYRFGEYHGSRKYFCKYFLLRLNYLLNIEKRTLNIDIQDYMTEKELQYKYEFSNRFMNESETLVNYCNELISESYEWNSQYNSRIKGIKNLENTKNWIMKNKYGFEKLKLQIEKIASLDKERKSECEEEILTQYLKYSEIENVSTIKTFDEIKDSNLEFVQIGYRPLVPKDCFLQYSDMDCSILWLNYAQTVAFGEINYFTEQIFKDKKIERINLERSQNVEQTYRTIDKVIKSLKNKGFYPTTIFMPFNFRYELTKNNEKIPERDIRFVFENNEPIYKFDEETKLKVIDASNYTRFDDCIIMDRNFIHWTFKNKKENDERLIIEIKEYEENKEKVDLTIKTVINLKIIDHSAICILRIMK